MKNTDKHTAQLAKTTARIVPALSGFDPAEILAADKITRTLAQISRHPLVQDISDEREYGDGIWVYLKDGFINGNTDTASIHEDTVAECLALLKTAWFDIRDTESKIFTEARAAAKEAQNEDEANAIAIRVLQAGKSGTGSAAQDEANRKWNESISRENNRA